MLLSFAACSSPEDPGVSELLEEKVLISNNKNTTYKVITSGIASSAIRSCFSEFVKRLEEVSGASFKTSDDFLRSDIDPAAQVEIVVAYADRAECKALYDTIKYDGYAIKNEGNKIIIAAYTSETLLLAIDDFFNKCTEVVTDENGNVSYYFIRNITVEGEKEAVFNVDKPLSSYKIVYSKEAEEAAKTLRSALKKSTKLELPMALDKDTEETENEILIGATNRKASTNLAEIGREYVGIKVVGNKIVIRSGTVMNINVDMPTITSWYFSSAIINFSMDFESVIRAYRPTDRVNLTNGADFRIMSFNILSEEWATNAGQGPRISGVVGCILEYKPEIIGIQEVSTLWYKELKERIGDEYEFVNSSVFGVRNYNYTALAYRKDSVELVDSDYFAYSQGNDPRLRLINMGVFKLKSSQKQLVVINTHFNGDREDIAKVQANEFVTKVNEYKKKYDCPLIATGDYNCSEGSAPYNIMMNIDGFAEAKHTAKSTGVLYSTGHPLNTKPSPATTSIDHIFYTGNVVPLYFTTLMDDYLLFASDHCPIFADFKFQ